MITLRSKDDITLKVDRKNAMISKIIKVAIDDDIKTNEVPILAVNGDILSLCIKFMEHHQGKEPNIPQKPLKGKTMKECCDDPWDAEFLDEVAKNRQSLYNLILAANYLEINSLLHLGCAKIATIIKGKRLEKLKSLLDPAVQNDEKSNN